MMLGFYLFGDSVSVRQALMLINKITFHKLDENCLVVMKDIYQALPLFSLTLHTLSEKQATRCKLYLIVF